MSALDPRELRNAFGSFMTGVTVVTAVSPDGAPVGFTANAYSSVSLDPPLLLVCPAKSLSSFEVFANCRHFAVNILAEDQQDISNVFATSKADRFVQVSWHADGSGSPIIDGAAASFSCAAYQRTEAGDHLILVGRIGSFEASGAAGLGYSNRGYFSLGMERKAQALPSASRRTTVGVIVEHEGLVLMEDTPDGLRPPQVALSGRTGSLAAIISFLSAAGLEVEIGPVYSIFEHKKTGEAFTYYRGVAKDGNPGGLGSYIPADQLAARRFASDALSDMMRRYLLERRGDLFGLYVGDHIEGDVHMFGEGPKL